MFSHRCLTDATSAYAGAQLLGSLTSCQNINSLWLDARRSLCLTTMDGLSTLYGFQVRSLFRVPQHWGSWTALRSLRVVVSVEYLEK